MAGVTSLSTSGSITLDDIHNDFQGTVIATANTVSLTDANDLTLGDIDVTGNLTVTAGGTVTLAKRARLSVGGEIDFGTTTLHPSWRSWTKRGR